MDKNNLLIFIFNLEIRKKLQLFKSNLCAVNPNTILSRSVALLDRIYVKKAGIQ